MVFMEIIKEMNNLSTEPIIWKVNDSIKESCVYFLKGSMDALARCVVQGTIQFNGEYGCDFCKEPGRTITKGRGHCRIYDYNTYVNDILRTDKEHRELVLQRNFSLGIHNASPLLLLN